LSVDLCFARRLRCFFRCISRVSGRLPNLLLDLFPQLRRREIRWWRGCLRLLLLQ
jgi:hypothetical protein